MRKIRTCHEGATNQWKVRRWRGEKTSAFYDSEAARVMKCHRQSEVFSSSSLLFSCRFAALLLENLWHRVVIDLLLVLYTRHFWHLLVAAICTCVWSHTTTQACKTNILTLTLTYQNGVGVSQSSFSREASYWSSWRRAAPSPPRRKAPSLDPMTRRTCQWEQGRRRLQARKEWPRIDSIHWKRSIFLW